MAREAILGRRLRSPELTEARLLQAAEEVFGERGYAKATIADVVERAAVSRGAFYLYFDNKEDVFRTLVGRVIADLFEVTTRRSSGTLRQRVAASTRAYLEAFRRHRQILRCLFEVSSADDGLARLHDECRARFIERIRRHLERARAAGQSPPLDPRVAAYALGLMIENVGHSWLVKRFEPWPGGFELEAVVQQLTDLWCRAAYRDGAADLP